MDNEGFDENNELAHSSSSFVMVSDRNTTGQFNDKRLGDYFDQHPFTFGCQTRKPDNETFGIQVSRPTSGLKKSNVLEPRNRLIDDIKCLNCNDSNEPYCHVTLDSIVKLKDSTRKLLCLLEEIQSKTHSKVLIPNDPHLTDIIKPISISPSNNLKSVTDVIGAGALKRLESQTKTLEAIYVEGEDDDCSVYKRLTGKCHCLNQKEYNDFIIHFNENTKYFTSTTGEIIKNMRILKKFIYMGGGYAKNALNFLNDGLSESSHTERVEITQGISYADVCNVFEEHSIVIICISWPCKYENYGDSKTQALTAGLLYKLSQLEEGRRYLKFSSKITNDIKKVLRKKASKLELDTLETLNATLNLMHPLVAQHTNVTYYCKPDEGFGNKTLYALVQYRQYMTLDEVFTHLDLLHNLSKNDHGKTELTLFLPALLGLFKHMLMEYNNSEMNIIVTNILNNIVAKNMVKEKESALPKTMIIADTATEPIKMKNEMIQMPPKKRNAKKVNKSKLGLAPNKICQQSKRKSVSRNPFIIVPVEE